MNKYRVRLAEVTDARAASKCHIASQIATYEAERELDFSYGVDGYGRFRINYHSQRGSIGAAIRPLRDKMPTFEELGLNVPVVTRLLDEPQDRHRRAEYRHQMQERRGARRHGQRDAAGGEPIRQRGRNDHAVAPRRGR